MRKILYMLIIFVLVICPLNITAGAHIKPDDISFTDYSGIISDEAKDYIKSKNEILFGMTKAKIIFVTTDTTDGLSAIDYAKNLYSSWNISDIGRNNSVFAVISPKSHDYGIIQGKNIKRVLNDSVLYEIISKDFEPYFADKNYDYAVLSLYNSIGRWYEEHYLDLNLELDSDFEKYSTGNISSDIDKKPQRLWLWISIAVVFIMIIVFFRIKRSLDFKTRQQERLLKRKKSKADIDKIVNS